jgi:hypothetical protein
MFRNIRLILLSQNKRLRHRFYVERFSLEKLNEVEGIASVLESCFVPVIMLSVDGLMRKIEQILKHSFLNQASTAPHFRRL